MMFTARRIRPRASAALALAACAGLALTTPVMAEPAGVAATAHTQSPAPLDQVQALLDAGRFVQAQVLLGEFQQTRGELSNADEARLSALLAEARRMQREAPQATLNLQRAELHLLSGDLVAAEAVAKVVIERSPADSADAARAQALLDQAAGQRADLLPRLPDMLNEAERLFAQGRYQDAAARVRTIGRTGADLGADRARFDNLATTLLELSTGRTTPGVTFGLFAADAQPAGDQPADAQPIEVEPIDVEPIDLPPVEITQPAATEPAAAQPIPGDLLGSADRSYAAFQLSQADAAFNAGNYATAEGRYTEVLSNRYRQFLTPDQVQQAQDRLSQSTLRLRGTLQGGVIDDLTGGRQIERGIVISQFQTLIASSEQQLARREFVKASNDVAQALNAIQLGRNVLSESEFEQYSQDARQLLLRIEQAEKAEQDRVNQELVATVATEAERQRAELSQRRDQRIIESLGRIRALQAEMKYEEALQVVDELLFIDPNNPAALLLRDLLRDSQVYQRVLQLDDRRARTYVNMHLATREAAQTTEDIIAYPEDWPEKVVQRGQPIEFRESAANQTVLAALESKRIPVNFSDNALRDVLTFLRNVAQVQMDLDEDSLEDIGVDMDTPVTLQLTEVSVSDALERVLAKVSSPDLAAGWAVNDGVLTIASQEFLDTQTVLEIYNISDLLFEIRDFDELPDIQIDEDAQNPFQQEEEEDEDALTKDEIAEEIIDIIKSAVPDREDWIDQNGNDRIRYFRENLIINTTTAKHRAIVGMLKKLREIRSLQISVEARVVEVNSAYFEQLGFDLDIVFNADNNLLDSGSFLGAANDPSVLPSDLFNSEGRLNRTVTTGVPIFDTANTPPTPNAPADGATPIIQRGNTNWSPINTGQNSLDLAGLLVEDIDFATTVLASSPALTVGGRFLDDIQVDFLVQATQADRRTVTLTAPRLTFTNGQLAYVVVANSETYVSDLEPVVGTSAAALDPTTDTVESGADLLIRGVVTADRRYVILEPRVRVYDAIIEPSETFQAVAGGTGGSVGGGIASGIIGLPTQRVNEVRTTVTVPDEGTVMLGGQRIFQEASSEVGVPVLSQIPILNRFFTNRIDAYEEATILILIKPTILIQSEQEEKAFPGITDLSSR